MRGNGKRASEILEIVTIISKEMLQGHANKGGREVWDGEYGHTGRHIGSQSTFTSFPALAGDQRTEGEKHWAGSALLPLCLYGDSFLQEAPPGL